VIIEEIDSLFVEDKYPIDWQIIYQDAPDFSPESEHALFSEIREFTFVRELERFEESQVKLEVDPISAEIQREENTTAFTQTSNLFASTTDIPPLKKKKKCSQVFKRWGRDDDKHLFEIIRGF